MSISHTITIIRSRRKSISISIAPDLTVIVKAPNFTPKFLINRFIASHEEWINKQVAQISVGNTSIRKKYKTGETFLFLGLKNTLEVGNYPEISLQKNILFFPSFLLFRAQRELESWYKKQARTLITKQVQHMAETMKTSYSEITFSDTKSQWGSCTKENKLQFSWRLIMAPYLTMQYVVIHELAHTIEKNHSRSFWRTVESHSPTYRIQRRWLKRFGNTLAL